MEGLFFELVEVVLDTLGAGLLDEPDLFRYRRVRGPAPLQGLGNGRVGHLQQAGDVRNSSVWEQVPEVGKWGIRFNWLHFSCHLLPLNTFTILNVGKCYQK